MNGTKFRKIVEIAKEFGYKGVFIYVMNTQFTYVDLCDLVIDEDFAGYKNDKKITYICIDKITSFTFQ